MRDPKELLQGVHWLGHASFRLDGSKTVYVDPWEVSGGGKADLILITHDHYDHCSPPDVEKLAGPGTVIVAPPSCAAKLGRTVVPVKPGTRTTAQGLEIEAVWAYNPKKQFHPRTAEGVGYLFVLDGVRFYHTGDTDRIPEMESIRADVAFLPVGGTYTMDARDAAQVAAVVQAQVAVPMHFGKIVGSEADAEAFRAACTVPVVILPRG